MDRGTWQATVHGVAKSQRKLSNFHFRDLGGARDPPEFKSRPDLTRHTFEKPQESGPPWSRAVEETTESSGSCD